MLMTQPSLTHWKRLPHFDGVWELTRQLGPVPVRGVAVQLQPGCACVYSPPPGSGEAAIRELSALGRLLLLAPNKYHTLGLLPYARLHPGSEVISDVVARERLRKKTGLPIQELSHFSASPSLPVATLVPPGTRNGETWLSIQAQSRRAWIVGDAFLNLSELPPPPHRWIIALTNSGPGLSIGGTFKLMVKRKRAYRDYVLNLIEREQPTMLIPCHGDVLIDDELPQRLSALVRARL